MAVKKFAVSRKVVEALSSEIPMFGLAWECLVSKTVLGGRATIPERGVRILIRVLTDYMVKSDGLFDDDVADMIVRLRRSGVK